MAAQSSPSRPRSARRRKHFSLAEANRSLPLVSRIVRDIVQYHQAAVDSHVHMESAATARQIRDCRENMESSLERMQEYVDELTKLGVELKDPETGLVDFPGVHQGREVWLCWRLGEEKVEFWHELQAGFAKRQPASLLDEGL
ncbi:MAG: DUF2203 domain-containing protein [Tepidisphaeraceae bacterium]|jgi:hypothetical protein